MDSEAPARQPPHHAPAPRGQLRWHIGTGSSCGLRPGPCLRAVPSARAGRPSADRPHAHRDPRSRRRGRSPRSPTTGSPSTTSADSGREASARSKSKSAPKGKPAGSLLRAAVRRLKAAGCRAEPPIPKVIRALGPRASGPPDVVVPRIGADATVDTLLRYATSPVSRPDPVSRPWGPPRRGSRRGPSVPCCHPEATIRPAHIRPAAGPGADQRTARQAAPARRQGRGRARHRRPDRPSQGQGGPAARPGRRRRRTAHPPPGRPGPRRLAPRCWCRSCASPGYDQLLDSLVSIAAQPPIAAEPARPGQSAGRRSGRRLDPATLAAAETRRPGSREGLARRPVARRPHPGQAVPLRSRGRRTGLRPPGLPVRGGHRRGPGHPRRSSGHGRRRGVAPRHRRRSSPRHASPPGN